MDPVKRSDIWSPLDPLKWANLKCFGTRQREEIWSVTQRLNLKWYWVTQRCEIWSALEGQKDNWIHSKVWNPKCHGSVQMHWIHTNKWNLKWLEASQKDTIWSTLDTLWKFEVPFGVYQIMKLFIIEFLLNYEGF